MRISTNDAEKLDTWLNSIRAKNYRGVQLETYFSESPRSVRGARLYFEDVPDGGELFSVEAFILERVEAPGKWGLKGVKGRGERGAPSRVVFSVVHDAGSETVPGSSDAKILRPVLTALSREIGASARDLRSEVAKRGDSADRWAQRVADEASKRADFEVRARFAESELADAQASTVVGYLRVLTDDMEPQQRAMFTMALGMGAKTLAESVSEYLKAKTEQIRSEIPPTLPTS